ncbi:MAG: FkbM family methyltransferase [Saprospirales bacterium]|nr:FkbM family methyltransferase [Saprospirales bacterium]MBK8922235.1 FkbM family methyltransferase [Saprospirales bacterium]
MRLKPSDIGHRSIQINGFYELALTRQITTLARSGGMLVDAGANYGYFSILWLANNPANRCVAFEAAPGNTPALQDNIQRNGLSERIQVETMALSDQTGWVDFIPEDTGGQTGWGGITRQALAGSIRVPATTLGQYWIKHYPGQHIAVLKIDVEGADTLVLQGARHLLAQQQIRHIFFEINRPRMHLLGLDEFQAQELLESYGYKVEQTDVHERHAYW